jgi:hypothetical protein
MTANLAGNMDGIVVGGPVEEEDTSALIVGDDSLHEIVENTLQILFIGQDVFESYRLHGPSIPLPAVAKDVSQYGPAHA